MISVGGDDGAKCEHLLSTVSQVKHCQAWSPCGRGLSHATALHVSPDFSGVKFYADSKNVP